MGFALQKGSELGKRYAWLGVWEKNTSALAFYRKKGFTEAGTHTFRMGEEDQTDYIMKRQVDAAGPEDRRGGASRST
jgi:ribosomal protein S18 acetylase RimI-like enzyme